MPLTDVYNSTTLIPYLENLYEEYYDEDGTYGAFTPRLYFSCARWGCQMPHRDALCKAEKAKSQTNYNRIAQSARKRRMPS